MARSVEQHLTLEARLDKGAKNLLVDCADVRAGQEVLIVTEDEPNDYYDTRAPAHVARVATEMGTRVHAMRVPSIAGPESLPSVLAAAIAAADHTIFFSRIGDQLRFSSLDGAGTKTMCYALDSDYLASAFCTVPQAAMYEILEALERVLAAASEWRITCPLGTDLRGSCEFATSDAARPAGFTLLNFPVGTFRPLSCKDMHGRAVVSHWLTPTGVHVYEPDHLALDATVTVVVENGRVTRYEGAAETVDRVRRHYDRVAASFDIDPDVIQSWHAGIHPQTYYSRPPAENLWRWANLTFSSPRRVHFHTCGGGAPGEISWSVFDASIEVDSDRLWCDGRFEFLERDDIRTRLHKYPDAAPLYEMRTDIGV